MFCRLRNFAVDAVVFGNRFIVIIFVFNIVFVFVLGDWPFFAPTACDQAGDCVIGKSPWLATLEKIYYGFVEFLGTVVGERVMSA